MECNIPVLTKCCFFFPLRPGMVVYGYFKMVVALVMELIYTDMLIKNNATPVITGITIGVIIIDTVASFIFILGCHKKSITIMLWFYMYNIYLLSVKIIYLFIVSLFRRIPWQPLPNIFITAYLLLLIRSEVIKLNKEKTIPCEFVNRLANSKCVLKIDVGNLPKPENGLDKITQNNGMEQPKPKECDAEKANEVAA